MMTRILHLNLHRDFFVQIATETKRTEYRNRTTYWRRRSEGRRYDVIQSRPHFVPTRQVRNGDATQAPEKVVEFRGARRIKKWGKSVYAIRLGRILQTKRSRS